MTAHRFFKIAFWLALLVTLWFAWIPTPPTLIDNDKSQHMLAFAVLSLLFSMAYPKVRWYWVLGIFALVGAAIEVVQLVPALHRTSDLRDWYADMAAVGVVMILTRISGWIGRRGRTATDAS